MLGMARSLDTYDLLCLDLLKAERIRKSLPGAEERELWAAGKLLRIRSAFSRSRQSRS